MSYETQDDALELIGQIAANGSGAVAALEPTAITDDVRTFLA